MAAALTFPRFESRIFPGFVSPMSVSAAMAIYSSIAPGMFVFFFSLCDDTGHCLLAAPGTWIARDPVMSHALGVFTATFLYGIAALSPRRV
jgi:hypothetical protein